MADFATALNQAVQLHQSGQLAAAQQQYRSLLQQYPNQPDLLHLLGLIEHQSGRYAEAVNWIDQALQANPNAYVFHANVGESHRQLGHLDQAVFHLRQAVQLNPNFAPPLNSLGIICRTQGRLPEAMQFYQRALQLNPQLADAEINLGLVLRELGRNEEALQHARRGIQLNPRSAAGHNNLANVLKDRGEIQEAIEHYRQAMQLDPNYGQAYSNWAQSRRFGPQDREELQRMEDRLASGRLTRNSASDLHFALGKAYDDCGDWEAAFAHFQQANQLAKADFDCPGFQAYVEKIMRVYDAPFFQRMTVRGSESRQPIFIFGMPRSGTSLVEQILASHEDVLGVGERKEIALMTSSLTKRLGAQQPYPDCVSQLDARTAACMAQEYLDALRGAGGEASRVVDKMMTNYLHAGLIALLFPRASIVHCRRDPLDVCLSCYFQNFSHRPGHTFDLRHLGFYYRQYARLMQHWSAHLPLTILELSYEDLIADQERESRRLLDFCGLSWDPRCLDFHKTTRVVQTASSFQVRQPLNRRSLQRWKNYERHLQPLREALGDVLDDA